MPLNRVSAADLRSTWRLKQHSPVREVSPGLGDDGLKAARKPSAIGRPAGGRARPAFGRLHGVGDQASRRGTPQLLHIKNAMDRTRFPSHKLGVAPLEKSKWPSHLIGRQGSA